MEKADAASSWVGVILNPKLIEAVKTPLGAFALLVLIVGVIVLALFGGRSAHASAATRLIALAMVLVGFGAFFYVVAAPSSPRFRSRLSVFPKIVETPSGVTVDVRIDGRPAGTISNLDHQETIDLGELSLGDHAFDFENIRGYLVHESGADPIPGPGFACNGHFTVTSETTHTMAIWWQPGLPAPLCTIVP